MPVTKLSPTTESLQPSFLIASVPCNSCSVSPTAVRVKLETSQLFNVAEIDIICKHVNDMPIQYVLFSELGFVSNSNEDGQFPSHGECTRRPLLGRYGVSWRVGRKMLLAMAPFKEESQTSQFFSCFLVHRAKKQYGWFGLVCLF